MSGVREWSEKVEREKGVREGAREWGERNGEREE